MSTTTGTTPTSDPGAAGQEQGDAVALLYGEPLFELPQDLYIPPDALEIFLETFEGPLDLLLYLIRRQNFNILDIPMVALTRQYLAYVDEISARNLELAAEYLLMAALLIEIKSRVLLPRPPASDEDEAPDPRAELVRRLLEYEQIKQGAARLAEQPQQGSHFFIAHAYVDRSRPLRLPDVSADELQAAWAGLLRRAQLVRSHTIAREELSVREHMSHVLRRLRGRRFMRFEELFDPARGTPLLVVTLLAVLELARERLVELVQERAYAPIHVRLAFAPVNDADSALSVQASA